MPQTTFKTIDSLQSAIKTITEQKTKSEQVLAGMTEDIRRVAESSTKSSDQGGWLLDVLRRDGNNEMRSLRIRPEKAT